MEQAAAVDRSLTDASPGAATAEIRSVILRASSLRSRIDSVDLLRGLVMVERRRWLIRWGTAITVGFILLRATNIYGDPGDWSAQKSAVMTVVSFLNVQKYPPSLLFLMMTLGPALLALGLWEKYNTRSETGDKRASPGPVARMLITYGRVPLFFYILQWIYAHSAGYLLSLIAGKPTWIYFRLPGPGPTTPPNVGFDLWVVFAAWLVGVLLIYPLCKWYAGMKARRSDWWLSYL